MNGWTVVILVLDVAAVSWVVVAALRSPHSDEALRPAPLAAAGLGGTLIALVAFRVEILGPGRTVMLIGAAALAGFAAALRIGLGRNASSGPLRPIGTLAVVAITLLVLVRLGTTLNAPGVAPGELVEEQSQRFGVAIDNIAVLVPARVVAHPPTLADTGTKNVVAIPLERYSIDLGGQALTLIVRHETTCRPVEVLLASAGNGRMDVVVVYAPTDLTRTRPPDTAPVPVCLPDESAVIAPIRTAIEIHLPAGMNATAVRDVSAGIAPLWRVGG